MVAVIDFEGFLNGTPFQGGKGEDYSLHMICTKQDLEQ